MKTARKYDIGQKVIYPDTFYLRNDPEIKTIDGVEYKRVGSGQKSIPVEIKGTIVAYDETITIRKDPQNKILYSEDGSHVGYSIEIESYKIIRKVDSNLILTETDYKSLDDLKMVGKVELYTVYEDEDEDVIRLA